MAVDSQVVLYSWIQVPKQTRLVITTAIPSSSVDSLTAPSTKENYVWIQTNSQGSILHGLTMDNIPWNHTCSSLCHFNVIGCCKLNVSLWLKDTAWDVPQELLHAASRTVLTPGTYNTCINIFICAESMEVNKADALHQGDEPERAQECDQEGDGQL